MSAELKRVKLVRSGYGGWRCQDSNMAWKQLYGNGSVKVRLSGG